MLLCNHIRVFHLSWNCIALASSFRAVSFQNGLLVATDIFYSRSSTADATRVCTAVLQGISSDNDSAATGHLVCLQHPPQCEWPSRCRRIVWRPGFSREQLSRNGRLRLICRCRHSDEYRDLRQCHQLFTELA